MWREGSLYLIFISKEKKSLSYTHAYWYNIFFIILMLINYFLLEIQQKKYVIKYLILKLYFCLFSNR